MKRYAWHLPWTIDNVPHALLDILRGCNIKCHRCYNKAEEKIKTLSEIQSELRLLLTMRRLQSISIVGGEPTLHPGLFEIITMLKLEKVFVEIFTNGVLLDAAYVDKLKRAGTDVIFLHIDSSQTRIDLPDKPSYEAVNRLRHEKARRIVRSGMEAGMSVVGYPNKVNEIHNAISFFLSCPEITYLLVTLESNTENIPELYGDLYEGIYANTKCFSKNAPGESLNNFEMMALLEKEFNLKPFAYIGSNLDENNIRWLSYLIASNSRGHDLNLQASGFEKFYLKMYYRWMKKYTFYQQQNLPALFAQILFNGLFSGNLLKSIKFLIASGTKQPLKAKRILFQHPAEVNHEGELEFCKNCPDAVVKDGRLVPVCISDRITPQLHKKDGKKANKPCGH